MTARPNARSRHGGVVFAHSAKRVPTDHVRATHAKVSQPEHRRKRPPPQIDPEAARQRQVRHAIEDRMIERELGLR